MFHAPKGGRDVSAQRIEDAWQIKAACRGPHSELFYPPQQFERKDEKVDRESRAKGICASCSVKRDCLDYALSIREMHGIWGGLNEAERKQVMAQRGL
ncbi:MAG: WhiB family transcriptional regulator [Acidimicrobiales bacterium]|nr:WhiB family transcriptional regulator [Acidimicrobiales bacterium]